MREGPAITIRREDYVAPAYWIRSVDLSFDLDPAKTIVANRMRIQRNSALPAQPLKLHGEGLNLLRVLVDGESVSFRHEDGMLVIDSLAEIDKQEFTLDIRNTCAPDKNTQLTGLYTSGGGFFTQCEAECFRRITYFLDRPDVMAVFSATLRADKALFPVLLCNGNLVEQGDLAGGRHFAKWHDPFPKPSYLFALVAADLVVREQHVRTRSGKDHLLQVYVRRGDLDKTEHAMNSLIASVVWDEVRFNLPLDLERFMIVAVGDFNMGAMENKGLNIFNTKYVLASPATATDNDFKDIESVVGHEYFHNWTGNRITCRDWFQLSLKEGLTVFRDQEFSMDMAGDASARAVKRIHDVIMLRQHQFPEDAGSMAHPVRPDTYQAIDNFYTATVYEKGAEVVRMMHTLVGRAGFAKGMALYFQRHDGQAVTCDDFAQAIADANPGSGLATRLAEFKRWYAQAGTPRVTARSRYDAASRSFTVGLEQSCAATPGQGEKQPFVIPVAIGLVGRDGRAIGLQLEDEPESTPGHGLSERVLVLDEAKNFYTFVNVEVEPVASLMRGFSAPVTLVDGLAEADLITLLAHDSDPFNRWEAGQRLMLACLLDGLNSGAAPRPSQALLDVLRSVLRHPTLAPAFKEEVLTPPSERYVSEQLALVDPQRVHAACESLKDQLAAALRDDWAWAFEQHQPRGGYLPDAEQSGQRALANLALAMRVRDAIASGDTVWPGRAYQRFKDARNMTDRLGALAALLDADAPLAEAALARFHELFKSDPLVVDKWFVLQSSANERAGRGLGRVKALMQHPDFTLHNPNRARSVVHNFAHNNPAAFHRRDAAGYVFWAEQVLEIDSFNPSLAARLARALDRWPKLDEPYRSAAREALLRVAKAELSGDTREIIDRALAAAA